MNKAFTVLKEISNTFEDVSMLARDFAGNDFSHQLIVDSYLYIGLYKPFDFIYFEIEENNTSESVIGFEYFSQTGWKSLRVVDETYNFKKSGFVVFEKPSDWKKELIDLSNEYFIRAMSDENVSPVKFRAVGVIFSSDVDLLEEKSGILSNFNEKSLVLKHLAARKDIVQEVRSWGETKSIDGVNVSDITEFDLQLDQVRNASKYLTMSKIYQHDLSQNPDDSYFQTGKSFYSKYKSSLMKNIVCIDRNDNGTLDIQDSRRKVGSRNFA